MPRSSAAISAEVVFLDVLAAMPGGQPAAAGSGRIPVIMLAPGGAGSPAPNLSELAARIGAALTGPAANRRNPERFRFGRAWLDLAAARLTGEDGGEIPLTAMEFNLLRLFARNRGRVLSRDQILEGAHDRPWDPYDRSIDIRISRIRRKIEPNPGKPETIRTVRGIGYIYDPR